MTSQSRKRVYFLTNHGVVRKQFEEMKRALPDSIDGELKSVTSVIPWSIFCKSTVPDGMSEEKFADIARLNILWGLSRGPKIDAEKFTRKMQCRAIQLYKLFLRELKDVDLLVVWNGFPMAKGAAAMAAHSLGAHVAYCENGVLPGTIAIDAKGVNYNCSLTGKDAKFYKSFPYDEQEVKGLYQTVWPQRMLRKANLLQKDINNEETIQLPSRYILYAMQVHDDSQIQLLSPRFRSMHESVSYVYEQMNEYNASTGDNLQLVVKEHPSDYGRIDYTDMRKSMHDVTFLRTTPIRDLIKTAQAVVTVNSSVGVEAMFSDRPIITLGQAFYNVPGLVCHIDESKKLADHLPSLLTEKVDSETRKHFLNFLWNQYLIPCPDRSEIGAQRGAQRIVDILNDSLPW